MAARNPFQHAAHAQGAKLLSGGDGISDTVNLEVEARALYVGGAGDVRLLTRESDDVVFSAVPAGSILPVYTQRVFSTNTSATLVIALT